MSEEIGGLAVGAVVLAAGQSRRMGTPKMLLPWGNTTVIGRVVRVLKGAGVAQIMAVTGASRAEVEASLRVEGVTLAHNEQYLRGEMLGSLQVGLRALREDIQAVLVVLGDQPQIETQVVRQVIARAGASLLPLVVPSYQNRRGHPWLARRALWPELCAMDGEHETLRDFLNRHAQQIAYVNVDTGSVLLDLDTPEDYDRQKPDG